jgi:hypothetical protein
MFSTVPVVLCDGHSSRVKRSRRRKNAPRLQPPMRVNTARTYPPPPTPPNDDATLDAPLDKYVWDGSCIVIQGAGVVNAGARVEVIAKVLSNGAMKLSTSTTTDNRAQRHAAAKAEAFHRLSALSLDCKHLENDVQVLQAKVEDGADAEEAGREWAQLVSVKRRHKERIGEIRSKNSLTVTYDQRYREWSITVQPGVLTQVPWFDKPVVWRPAFEQGVVERRAKATKITEEMPVGDWVSPRLFLRSAREHKRRGEEAAPLLRLSAADQAPYRVQTLRMQCSQSPERLARERARYAKYGNYSSGSDSAEDEALVLGSDSEEEEEEEDKTRKRKSKSRAERANRRKRKRVTEKVEEVAEKGVT